jgi:DNA mismatch endonuclease (patch repair protein)
MSEWPGRTRQLPTTFGGLRRGELMSRIRSAGNATTELKLLRLLRAARLRGWRRGFPLVGKPDFVFPTPRVVVFVDGCFWHGHGCDRNLTPRRNSRAWRNKIEANRRRDQRVARSLRTHGWRVIRVWECALKTCPEACLRRIREFVRRVPARPRPA